MDLQRFPVVPLALAHLAGDVDVRQEVHLDLQQAVSLAGFAPAAPGVEGEAPWAVAPGLGVLGGGEQLPDVVEQPGIGGRIGPGRAANGGLVDVNDLVQELLTLDAVVSARPDLHPVQVGAQLLIQDLVHQRGLARAGHPGDTGEGPKGDLHIDVPKVVLCRPKYLQKLPVPLLPLPGDGDLSAPGQILAGDGAGGVHHLLRSARRHDLAPVDPRAGAYVDDIVGRPHGVLVMLHHQQGISQVPQVLHGFQQHIVVPLVQADGWLIQDIQHPHEGGADLRGQTDALALAAGQGSRPPGQGEVLQAHRLEEAQPAFDLLQNALRNAHLDLGQLQMVHKVQGLGHRLAAEGVNVQPAHCDGQGLLPQAAALTGRAGALAHAVLQLPAHGVGLGLLVPALQVVADPLKGLVQGALAPGLVIVEGELLPPGAVEDHVHHLGGQVLRRGVQLEAVLFGQSVEVHPGDAVGLDVAPAGGGDGPLQNGQVLVGNDELRIHLQLAAQAGAGGTGPVWVVEGKHPGSEFLNGHAAVLAGVVL